MLSQILSTNLYELTLYLFSTLSLEIGVTKITSKKGQTGYVHIIPPTTRTVAEADANYVSQRVWLAIRCRSTAGNSNKLALFKATRYAQNKRYSTMVITLHISNTTVWRVFRHIHRSNMPRNSTRCVRETHWIKKKTLKQPSLSSS